jgi:hypothetical protein
MQTEKMSALDEVAARARCDAARVRQGSFQMRATGRSLAEAEKLDRELRGRAPTRRPAACRCRRTRRAEQHFRGELQRLAGRLYGIDQISEIVVSLRNLRA